MWSTKRNITQIEIHKHQILLCYWSEQSRLWFLNGVRNSTGLYIWVGGESTHSNVMYDSEALRKDVEQSKRSLEFTVQPSNSTPRFKPKRTTNICPHKHLYINVHRSIIHNNQKVETTINEQRNKMWYIQAAAAKSLQSCPTLCNPIDGSLPGFPVPGILQARTLEWVAVSFSKARMFSRFHRVRLCVTP